MVVRLPIYFFIYNAGWGRVFLTTFMEHYFWDGEDHYFVDAINNLSFRHIELIHANPVKDQIYHDLVLGINKDVQKEPLYSWLQYQNPATYRGTYNISIPGNELPDTGTYRIWLPIPINNGPQTNVTIEFVTPDKWVKQPPSMDQEIGLLYMEVPMEEVNDDLVIQVVFTFTHYVQRFSVDPDNVGEYDRNSPLYKKYTQSFGNTEITPEIHKMAENIVGDEKNPYYRASKIYYYIVNNVDYSLMPHLEFWPRTPRTESVYVHEKQRGDCGAQSMYFTALCRSMGIPARTTGGWQLFMNEFGGHFWAEFYLPNYGWLPVDTSCAQTAFYPKELPAQEREAFIDFYFGNQDSKRCVVQVDTDMPLIPPAQGMILLPAAIQMPVIEYSIPSVEFPINTFFEYIIMECEKID